MGGICDKDATNFYQAEHRAGPVGEQPEFYIRILSPRLRTGAFVPAPLPSNFESEPFVSSLVRQMRPEALSIFNGAYAVSFSSSSGSCGSRLAATNEFPVFFCRPLSRKRSRFATIHMESFEGSRLRGRLENFKENTQHLHLQENRYYFSCRF